MVAISVSSAVLRRKNMGLGAYRPVAECHFLGVALGNLLYNVSLFWQGGGKNASWKQECKRGTEYLKPALH